VISGDLQPAKIFFSIYGTDEARSEKESTEELVNVENLETLETLDR